MLRAAASRLSGAPLARAARLGSRRAMASRTGEGPVYFREPDPSKPKLVLAYSGGLDTSCQLSWLAKAPLLPSKLSSSRSLSSDVYTCVWIHTDTCIIFWKAPIRHCVQVGVSTLLFAT